MSMEHEQAFFQLKCLRRRLPPSIHPLSSVMPLQEAKDDAAQAGEEERMWVGDERFEVCGGVSRFLSPPASLLRGRRPTRIVAVAADPPRDEGATLQPSSAASSSVRSSSHSFHSAFFLPMFCCVTSSPS